MAQRPLPLPTRGADRPTLAAGVLPRPASPAAATTTAGTAIAPGPTGGSRHHRQVAIKTVGIAAGSRSQRCHRHALLQHEHSHMGLQALDSARPDDRRAVDELLGDEENAAGYSTLQHERRELGRAGGPPRAERFTRGAPQQDGSGVVDSCAARRDSAPERRLLLYISGRRISVARFGLCRATVATPFTSTAPTVSPTQNALSLPLSLL
eukprot:SAG11_NODE_83_length_17378_cov_5.388622_12_plen_209_part_00